MFCLYWYATDVNNIAVVSVNSSVIRVLEKLGFCLVIVKVVFVEMFCEVELEIDGVGGGDGGGEGSVRIAVDIVVTVINSLDCKDVSSGVVFSVDEIFMSVVLVKELIKM